MTTSVDTVASSSNAPTRGEHQAANSRRVASVTVATVLMAVATWTAVPATAGAAPLANRSVVSLTGWNDDRYGSSPWGSSGGDSTSPWDSSQTGTATVDSRPATKTESKGVVLIDTVLGYQNAEAAGTGIVLTSDGEVLTNYHVVEGSTSIKVTVAATGKTYTAAVVGHDQTDDIALLQLKDASKLTVAKVDDDTHKLGGAVTAVGNAGGTDSLTAARGAILSLSATITTESEGSTAGETLQGLIETDADVVAGDSGGPLYDSEKEVIGINTAASTGTQINGYAIPIQTALKVVSQILTGKETSTVQVGAGAYLGIEVSSPLTAEQQSYLGEDSGWNQTSASGAEVAGVVADGPAAKAGLQTGDSITALGGTAVTSAEAISTLLGNYQPGDSVKVSWTDSEGETRSATVILAASPIA